MMTLFRHPLSGHSHRVELLLSHLGLEFDRVDVDLMKGEHRADEFLTRNPFGQVPVLLDGDVVLNESSAILIYLARRYGDATLLPADPVIEAEVNR